jgi:hypothetical protein
MKAFRTVLHGTCLLNGRHPEGSQLARECSSLRPALRRQERLVSGDQGVDSGSLENGPSDSLNIGELQSGLRDAEHESPLPLAHRRLKRGRPVATQPSRHARYRRRHPEYQEREAERLAARRGPLES